MKIKKLIHILIMAFWVSASVGATGNPYEELQKIFKEISENRNDAIKLQLNEQLKKKDRENVARVRILLSTLQRTS
jgi:hypothetical protein